MSLPRRSGRITSATFSANAASESTPSSKDQVKSESEDNHTRAPKNATMQPPPTTPRKKRKLASTDDADATTPLSRRPKPPLLTPTPSAIGFMTAPYSTGDIDDAEPRPPNRLARLAEPHKTNAPLRTPRGSKIQSKPAALPLQTVSSSLPRSASTNTETTTENLLQKACAHLMTMDPRLKVAIEAHPCHVFSPEGLAEEVDPFRSLASGIMAQQVSGAAATSIKNKFVALFNPTTPNALENSTNINENTSQHNLTAPSFPTPAQVAAVDITFLRTAGLSQRKAEYIKGLAEKFESGELTAKMLAEASDEEVLERLVKVRGLGRWSVEMFACFGLKRMDIFSTGDLGVQRGMAAYVGRDVAKLKAKGAQLKSKDSKWKYMSEADMLEISKGVNIEAMEGS